MAEVAHRLVMRVLAGRGQRAAAMAQYNVCHQVLTDELGTQPDGETVGLFEQIRSGKPDKETGRQGDRKHSPSEQQLPLSPPHFVSPSPSHPVSPSPPHDWGEAPETGRVYGRQVEMMQLSRWLVNERCQVVAHLGIGGVGKTTLAATATRQVASAFERVVWRSLLNAPPPDELLRAVLQTLTGLGLTQLPVSQDEQLTLLLANLRHQRCLLVLDNMESVMHAGPSELSPGQMRVGYEGYAQLIKRLAEHKYNSCLLLTSREQPQEMSYFHLHHG